MQQSLVSVPMEEREQHFKFNYRKNILQGAIA
jgi:hypothetical protein